MKPSLILLFILTTWLCIGTFNKASVGMGVIVSPSLYSYEASVKRTVYLVAALDARPWWVESQEVVAKAFADVAERSGLVEIIYIYSLEELDELIRNPPKDIVVVNCHGESIPMHPAWGVRWEDYYRAIGRNVDKFRWIWVSTAGYPFYYYTRSPEEAVATGSEGINTFLGVVEARADCWGGTVGNMTSLALREAEKFGVELPLNISIVRSISTDLAPLYIYYTSDVPMKLGVAAFAMGDGIYVHMGVAPTPEVSDELKGMIAALVILHLVQSIAQGGYVAIGSLSYDGISMKLKSVINVTNFNPYEEIKVSIVVNITDEKPKKIFEARSPLLIIKPGETAVASFEASIYLPGRYIVHAYIDPPLGKYVASRALVVIPITSMVVIAIAIAIPLGLLFHRRLRKARVKH